MSRGTGLVKDVANRRRPFAVNPTFALRVVFGAEKIFKWPWR